jgi:protein-L-isoaspartate(D-aspartate) O-methyltransferase
MRFAGSSGRRELLRAFLAGLLWMAGSASAIAGDRVDALVAEIEQDLARLGPALGFHRLSPAVVRAIREVPRHAFVPADQQAHAYRNRPLPIGYGQTISQPLIVAAMTELLQLRPGQRVFELGTGSGYQAAVLAALGAEVYSVEIVPPLAERARAALDATGYGAVVHTRTGDGYHGWAEAAPFDAIIVTAAGDHVPPPLLEQLKPGGRMVLPIGGRYFTQQLVLVTRQADGSFETRELIDVAFVPLTRSE